MIATEMEAELIDHYRTSFHVQFTRTKFNLACFIRTLPAQLCEPVIPLDLFSKLLSRCLKKNFLITGLAVETPDSHLFNIFPLNRKIYHYHMEEHIFFCEHLFPHFYLFVDFINTEWLIERIVEHSTFFTKQLASGNKLKILINSTRITRYQH